MPGKSQPTTQKQWTAQKRRTSIDAGHGADGAAETSTTWAGVTSWPSIESWLFGLAIVIGLLLRLFLLDSRPLSVDEGGLAAQAFRIMMGQFGEPLRDGPLPTYGTAMSLSLFAAGDGAARLLSVVAGSCLVAVPYLFRNALGRPAALVASMGLALSPLLLFASRTVGSGIVPALLALLLWWVASGVSQSAGWKPYCVAGLMAALVTSGPAGLTAMLALGLAALLSHPSPGDLVTAAKEGWEDTTWRRAAIFFAGAIAAISTAFGANLSGIQYLLVDLWASWLGSFNLLAPRGVLIWTLASYELPILLIALGWLVVTLIRRERVDMFLALWAMILLLLGMVQPSGGLARTILPAVPLYLMASRAIAATSSLARAASVRWRWLAGLIALGVPTLVLMIILNRSTILGEPVPQEYIYGAGLLAVCAILIVIMLLDGPGRKAVGWYYIAFASLAFWIHSTAFLNYRAETWPAEFVAGQQISSQLRQAALDDSYYSTYFNARVTVDPQLKLPLEWYLRNAKSVEYATDGSRSISIELAPQTPSIPPAGSERAPGLYSPTLEPSWGGLWSWAMSRGGMVRPNPRDIILRIPLSVW